MPMGSALAAIASRPPFAVINVSAAPASKTDRTTQHRSRAAAVHISETRDTVFEDAVLIKNQIGLSAQAQGRGEATGLDGVTQRAMAVTPGWQSQPGVADIAGADGKP